MRFALLILLLLVFTSSCFEEPRQENEIVGAFGFRLGDKFDPVLAKSVIELPHGGNLYDFQPSRPVRKYDRYYLQFVPKTKRIFRISAEHLFDHGQAQCINELEVLKGILTKQHGEFNDIENTEHRRISEFKSGNREIVLSCNSKIDSAIFVVIFIDYKI